MLQRIHVQFELIRTEMKTHPDRGGNAEDFKKVQQARKVLLA